ncbi:MAG: NADP-dependent isocitrate dehydrogenase, partial [Spirochaetales bacterium]|nr:NADP-dependent isocitrate dehydrogenase [Spirochaetales bacterium]
MMKIQMHTPLVELDGDEMTRVLWQPIKDKLLLPFIDLKTEYYDLGLTERDKTDDQITVDAAKAIMKYGVGVKNATITPNQARVEEYGLKKQWKSPNGTIRAMLDGTVFRKPIIVKNIAPAVRFWKKPIVVGRHAYGDIYKNAEIYSEKGGKLEVIATDKDGNILRNTIVEVDSPCVVMGMHNTL